MRDRERERDRDRDTGRGRSSHDLGLDPKTPGSCPGLKAGAKLLSYQGSPHLFIFLIKFLKYNLHIIKCKHFKSTD